MAVENIQLYGDGELSRFFTARPGETKLGQTVQRINGQTNFEESLKAAVEKGAKFAILGVPEDIGPRANYGRGGAGGVTPIKISDLELIMAGEEQEG